MKKEKENRKRLSPSKSAPSLFKTRESLKGPKKLEIAS